jgi:hypothetical protein
VVACIDVVTTVTACTDVVRTVVACIDVVTTKKENKLRLVYECK